MKITIPPITTGLCVVLLSIFIPLASHAESLIRELRVGILAHDVDNLWSGESHEDGTDFNAEVVFSSSLPVLGGTVRPNLGLTLNDSGDTSKVYGGGSWEYAWSNGFFAAIGCGIAIHDGETNDPGKDDKKQLGSHVLFRVSMEVGITMSKRHRLSVMFDHISNGYLTDPNEGLDTMGLRYGILF